MSLTNYPFIVLGSRSKIVNVRANKFRNALSKVLSLFPNKFVQTKFAKNMDLLIAQDAAKAKSLKSGHKQHVVLINGTFEVRNDLNLDEGSDVYAVYYHGKKIDLPPKSNVKVGVEVKKPKKSEVENEVKSLNKKEIMETKTAKKSAKVAAKKVAAKKSAAPVKKVATASGAQKVSGAKMVTISTADMLKKIAKGFRYYTPQGQRKGETTLASRPDQKAEHQMQEVAPE